MIIGTFTMMVNPLFSLSSCGLNCLLFFLQISAVDQPSLNSKDSTTIRPA